MHSLQKKLKTQEEISIIAEQLKSKGKTIITTNGSFDILHPAHINLFEQAKKEGDILIVLLNSDESIKRFKGPTRPILEQNDRASLLSALESVNYITIFEEDTPLNLIEKIKPHKHVKGGTFIEDRIQREKSLLAQWHGEFKTFPLQKGYSTTNIIDKILKTCKD